MATERAIRVRDPRALRALSHPLRLRLLGLLRREGPATASQLARRLGESSGATSYHLRELARFGFVAEVDGRGTARERWWQALHRMTSWQLEDFAGDRREAVEELQRRQLDEQVLLLGAWWRQRDALGQPWADAGSLNDYLLRLTPEQAHELAAELTAVLDRWSDRHDPAAEADGSELVSVLLDVLPLAAYPT